MSALPPKADMFSVELDVCLVPIADMSAIQKNSLAGAGSRLGYSPNKARLNA